MRDGNLSASEIGQGARLRQLARECGEAEAIHFLPISGGELSLSWAALNEMADRFARVPGQSWGESRRVSASAANRHNSSARDVS